MLSDQPPEPFATRVTLRHIAEKAGLSVAAVSLALRDNPKLPVETRNRVRQIAQKLGYTPDPALSALAAYRSRVRVFRDFSVVGLISNWSTQDAWTHLPSAVQLIEGATTRARELGYSLQHIWARAGGAKPGRINRILQARGIRGIILAPFEDPASYFPLDWNAYSVVTIERPDHYAQFHHIVPNHYRDLLQCWDKLQERGYSRVGLAVRRDLTLRLSHQWEAAHGFAQSRAGARLDFVPTLELNPQDQITQIRQWLRRHRPQAVIGRCEEFLKAAAAEGLRVPHDIGYVSLNVADDVPDATGIDQQRGTMGGVAMDVMNSLLLRNQRGLLPVSIGTQVDGTWCAGRTLGERPPSLTSRRRD